MVAERPAPATSPIDMEVLYRAHARPLYAFIYSKVGNREAAEDLTADVFMKAVVHLDLTRQEHSIVTWLYRVARNTIADYWRMGRGAHLVSLEEAHLVQRVAPVVNRASHTRAATRARTLLERLPSRYGTVLSHRLLEGLNVAETAQRMGISENNVKVLQCRALKRAAGLEFCRDDDTTDKSRPQARGWFRSGARRSTCVTVVSSGAWPRCRCRCE